MKKNFVRGIWRAQPLVATAIVCMLLLVTPHAALASGSGALKYKVIYSQDDGLCHPVVDFYNRRLPFKETDNIGFMEDQHLDEQLGPGISFIKGERDRVDDFTNWRNTLYPKLRIYNDDRQRDVMINDLDFNYEFSMRYSKLVVHKPGTVVRSISELSEDETSVELSVDFDDGGSSADRRPNNGDYIFKKVPRTKDAFYGLSTSVSQRPIRYRDKIYIVARTRGREPGADMLVYSLNSDGSLDDTCYARFKNEGQKHVKHLTR